VYNFININLCWYFRNQYIMLDPETQAKVSLIETVALSALQRSIDVMGWYWNDIPLGHFNITDRKLPKQAIKPPSETSPLSFLENDVITIQCRRESIIFTIGKDRYIPIHEIFQEVHQKVPRLDLEKPFQNFIETLSSYKKR